MRTLRSNRSGFSTIIAILLTAFLTVLSAGILGLYITESKISHALFNGVSTYAAAEGALEYAMLKIKNHREGFKDAITRDDKEYYLLDNSSGLRAKEKVVEYTMDTYATAYTGSIEAGGFEVIPLFFDQGTAMQSQAKQPTSTTDTVKKTDLFIVRPTASLVWNIVGNDASGETYGIVGKVDANQTFGNNALAIQKE